MTGPDLRLQREAVGVPASAIASRLGVNPSTVCRIEKRLAVRSETAGRYLAALATAVADRDHQRRRAAELLIQRGLLSLGGSVA